MSTSSGKKRKLEHTDSPHKVQKISHELSSSERKIAKVVNIGRFAENRAIEIQALTKAVKDVGGNHLAFQKLPRHMRRRAMSHNIKRVPRRLHEQVRSELDKVKAPNKRPSRRYRRKPSNLLSEYERRKRRISWLETHIWHAKRFKMVEKWGYRLPLHPNEKSIRACYRAVRRHCLLQDVSFESYIELKGDRETIIKGLEHLTSPETGLTFAARMTSRGTRQGSLILFCYDCYPYQAIGCVTYLWRPQVEMTDNDIGNDSTLWLCCQPSFQTDVIRELNKCFHPSVESHMVSDTVPDSVAKETQSVKGKDDVVITSLKEDLMKFRLVGPASSLVLRETLRLWDFEDFCEGMKENGIIKDGNGLVCESGEETKLWWKDFYKEKQNRMMNKQQKDAWEAAMGCQSPSEAPPHCIVSAVVRDPRLLLPPRRTKVFHDEKDYFMRKLPKELFNTAEVSHSPLWEESVRQNVKITKVLEKDLNVMKSKHLIPGTPLDMGEKESRIPVLLIQRPGFAHLHSPSSPASSSQSPIQEGYASGWDLLLPSGWAMAFWLALVYRGARVGGLREAHSISLQARQLNQIKDVPDSTAGKLEILSEAEAIQTKHDRRPPAKRPNYTKLGFNLPFSLPFDQLCKEWVATVPSLMDKFMKGFMMTDSPEKKEMYVLRHRRSLQLLNHALTDMKNFTQNGSSKIKTHSCAKGKKSTESNSLTTLLSEEKGKKLIDEDRIALVPVCVTVLGRGVPVSHARICKPSKDDLKRLSKDKQYGGPEETLHPDLDAPKRKKERKERLRIRRKRKQGKKVHETDSKPTTSTVIHSEKSKKDTPTQLDTLNLLCKETDKAEENSDQSNTKCPSLISHTSRSVMGFITKGDFNLGQGQGSGMGFCSVAALLHIIAEQRRQKHGVVLVRNPTSTQYRFASISIVL